MRAEHLKYFVSLAENHSLTKTSLEFYTTHQNVSKIIRQLEKEMGATLFDRTPQGMILTPQGKILLPAAKDTLQRFHQVRLDIAHMNRQRDLEGNLQIWGTPLATAAAMQPLIDDFCLLYPKVRYQVHDATPLNIIKHVTTHPDALGLIVVMRNPAYQETLLPYLAQIQQLPLLQDEYLCLVGSRSPLAKERQISFREFTKHPVAMFLAEGTEAATHPLAQILHILNDTTPALSTQNRQLYVQSIVSGHFIGLTTRHTHELLSAFAGDDMRLIPFAEDLTLNITLVTHSAPTLDEVSQSFLNLVKERAADSRK